MSLPTDRLATVSEVAQYLGVSVGALRTQRHRGQAPGQLGVVVGRKLRFRTQDVEAWLEEQAEAQRRNAS
jgi:excisionase family DNA binding protein